MSAQEDYEAVLTLFRGYKIQNPEETAALNRLLDFAKRVEMAEADNAALLGVCQAARQRMRAQDWLAAKEMLLEAEEKIHPGAALLERLTALETFAEGFALMAEAAVSNARREKGGMQVPFHGDFANITPSNVGRLEWWAREARRALGTTR